jgi:hypothetical protein
MHRLRSAATIRHFRLAAVLVCVKCVVAPLAAGILIVALITHDPDTTLISIGLVAATVLAVLLQWIFAARTNCPLCRTPVLANKGCSKHKNARKLFGSYRLRVSLTMLLKGRFRCPYCHETTAMEARDRSRSSKYSRG